MQHLYRALPSVDELLRGPLSSYPPGAAAAAARQVLDEVRAEIRAGMTALPDVAERVVERAELLTGGRLRPVINATGVVVHTNLGRSAWSARARSHALAAMGHCNLEVDLQSGRRGGRLAGVTYLMQALVGAEATLVVNNCAAAVLLALTALARDRSVICSRGELVEIGGSFRVPDVIASGGARLVEVGTTNRTRAGDYAAAITPETGALLRVHPSNFAQVGFTERPDRKALATLAREAGIPLLEDTGSGELDGPDGVRTALSEGADVVMFSGDKLLGGPQAGLLVGKASWVSLLRKHPLYRALRVDKVTLAALEGTLVDQLVKGPIPTRDRLVLDDRDRTERFSKALNAAGLEQEVVQTVARVGGGSMPEREIPSHAVRIAGATEAWAVALRTGRPAVMARLQDGALLVDLRAVDDAELPSLVQRLLECVKPGGADGSAG